MALISLKEVSYSYGGPPLFSKANFQIEPGEKIGLLGRNGAGKSTLMKMLNKEIIPDSGEVVYQQGVTVSRLIQEVPQDQEGTCLSIVIQGLGKIGEVAIQYHDMLEQLSQEDANIDHDKMESLQHQLDHHQGWDCIPKAESILTKIGIDGNLLFSSLSGGMKRRVLLAKSLISEPDVLLLDEPTNHLDIHSIRWMESFLQKYPGTLVFVTHDRAFLQNLSTRIAEVDRGKIVSWSCKYRDYLERREAAEESEQKSNSEFDKKLEKEEAWIRRGVKARRARNEGRVRALMKLREEYRNRRNKTGQVKMQITDAHKSGRLVSVSKNISFSYGNKSIINSFTYDIVRGDRIGLIGSNGSGKSTLVKLLLGELKPSSGTVELGTQLEIAYFDQLRGTLDESKTPQENLGIGGDYVEINGQRKHVMGYLQDFLFQPDQIRNPVSKLSGGEKNRLLFARLFIKPSNVLVLDEPTNDLDIETLEILEDLILNYQGTVILVSHDREFVNNLTSSTLVLEGDGNIKEYIDGYDTWLAEWENRKNNTEKTNKETVIKTVRASEKLSAKERETLNQLTKQIESLEQEIHRLQLRMAEPSFYEQNPQEIKKTNERFQLANKELEEAYTLWENLESKKG